MEQEATPQPSSAPEEQPTVLAQDRGIDRTVDWSKVVTQQEAGIKRQIVLPNRVALRMCWKSIVIRLGRAAITASGIFLGIAFFASVMTSSAIIDAARAKSEQEGLTVRQAMDDPTSDNLKARQIWLVIMALMVSVVGIANSMLMSVTERFREIGTMKCLGALDKFIVKLFLFESALLGLLGSLLGALLGILVMWLVLSFRYNFDAPYLQFLEICSFRGLWVWFWQSLPPSCRPGRPPGCQQPRP